MIHWAKKTQNVCITLPDIFLLLEDKHVMVEKLLQLLVTEVDANLFERVELENLKAWKRRKIMIEM